MRLQSGWQRTEREKGVYDFAWLDAIVDSLVALGLKSWMCLCYGNGLYGGGAEEVFGAVGVPPIFTDEQCRAWRAYVTVTVAHFRGRVAAWEVWNEPDGVWCWKHGPALRGCGAAGGRTPQGGIAPSGVRDRGCGVPARPSTCLTSVPACGSILMK